MIKQTTFKAGDKVYYPLMSDKILTVKRHGKNTIYVDIELFGPIVLGPNGKRADIHVTESLFHATQLNYELLTNLYPHIQFEEPKPTPKQVIKHLLRTHKYVACYTSDFDETPSPDSVKNFITHIRDGVALPFVDDECNMWRYAVPFDIKTGKVITEIEE
ncbi:hypothetical protein ABZS47_04765 [Moraxella catarrhalis]|uniref:hypothetical protein n=1 Tax=Moraxella catarrhalis TaxID=480 RepID=UPI000202AD76|nr:hypothetical protein [Moraxella catarrhalis]EGE11173.1 hypothetical protein E9K_09244 [Moraxella catarrhalis 103P14B1]EGE24379.1 hypothetical protein E9Y_05707 [Moraxella catarrhalis 101P30B1]MPX17792.1 hypothetical protein [Moraxella catarrhalis]MPX53608.1 hypothetical protein [Moraxella catarrhalis]MPX68604.1 hypothetical protein [Moraxella catarrhalis]